LLFPGAHGTIVGVDGGDAMNTDAMPSAPASGQQSVQQTLDDALRLERAGESGRALAIYETIIDAASSRAVTVDAVVTAMLRIGAIHSQRDALDVAAEIIEAATFIAAANGLEPATAHALIAQSTIANLLGKIGEAERLALAGRAQAEAVGAEGLVAIADNALAIIASNRGELSDALLRFASSLAYGRRAGDNFLVAMCLNNVGQAYLALGMPDDATARLEEAVDVGWRHFPPAAVRADATLATLHAEAGRLDEARHHVDRALDGALAADSLGAAASVFLAAASVAIAERRPRDAEKHARIAAHVIHHLAAPELPGELATVELSLHVASGEPGAALAALERAERCYAAVPDNWGRRRMTQRAAALDTMLRDEAARWIRALSTHAPYVGRAAHRVRALCGMLSSIIEMTEPERRALDIAASLHDIGFLALPEILAQRLDRLNSAERFIVQAHAEFGAHRLSEARYPESVWRTVRHHHERWDGTGYPDGLRAEQIPLGARMLAIVDRYVALRSARGNRSGFAEGHALRQLEREAGHAFDPALCERFISAIRSGLENTVRQERTREIASSGEERNASPLLSGAVSRSSAPDVARRLREAIGDRYILERELPGAGTAHIFVARDSLLDRRVAIKTLHSDDVDQAGIARFRREMALAARIRHPNVLPVLDARVDGPLVYFISPYIAGGSLRSQIEQGPQLIPVALRLMRDIALALAAAHAEGVVHRDLKPENVLIDSEDDGRAILADFGIARIADAIQTPLPRQLATRLTLAGVSIGTPQYMAPEQVFAQTELDARVDVYAFGLVAYELLAGTLPFVRGTAREMMVAHLTLPAPSILDARRDVPPRLALLIARALSKTPGERPDHGAALAAEIHAICAEANIA
jgi:HD-GYP domain-containing protein (c-di-GMP phosphodiesterase class II)